jgi:hypothetical protein
VGFSSELRYEVGQQIAIAMILPDGMLVRAKAQVCYVLPAPDGKTWVGACFVGIDPESHRVLEEAIDHLEGRPTIH